ncbi:MAG: FAD-dependent oxidoreductase, partial [Gammaproteobacteria bacterium]|nr:FAD-dependent oxidoreductase [Gammaproteobacteria bacterium]
MKTEPVDLAIIGAGPAGMAAAVKAAELGCQTVLIDEQAGPGGQIYRNTEQAPPALKKLLGPDYARGETLSSALSAAGVDYLPETTVWHVDDQGALGLSRDGEAWSLKARYILLATGAMERPCPVPGWTLPGVMTAGAGQILLKNDGMIPDGPVVLAGSGPLLYLLAWQYLNADLRIAALLDSTPPGQFFSALIHLPKALARYDYLLKGLAYIRALRKAGIPFYKGIEDLSAEGVDHLRSVSFKCKGRSFTIECRTLLLHQGVVPNLQITRALECEHVWNEDQACWAPKLDQWGGTDKARFYVAGDGAGIAGAMVAENQGVLSALAISHRLSLIDKKTRDAMAAPYRKSVRSHSRIRPFLDALYKPGNSFRQP